MQAAPTLHMSAELYKWLQCWKHVVYNGEKYSCPVRSKNCQNAKNSMSIINRGIKNSKNSHLLTTS